MTNRKSRRRHWVRLNRVVELLCVIMVGLALSGCRSEGAHGGLISTNLSLSSYADARQRMNPGQPSTLYFPALEIYNDAGVLLYRSHESMDNAKILRDFPNSVRDLPPQEDAPRLTKIVAEIPDFKAREQEILGKRQLVIVSVGLESCQACAAQETALDDLKHRLLKQQSVAILEINVAHP